MQVDANNYNVLGRLGPHYPQQEFRPKGNGLGKTAQDGTGQEKGSEKTQKKGVSSSSSEGRLNVQAAKALTAQTAQAIAELPPNGRNQAPHVVGKNVGLLTPCYV
ncbi:MAG: hypothetical protein LBT62_02080 [Deltaproteobacteria bacterium]|nr:hypothetical protein [Deltaproteobacteria bacterium]